MSIARQRHLAACDSISVPFVPPVLSVFLCRLRYAMQIAIFLCMAEYSGASPTVTVGDSATVSWNSAASIAFVNIVLSSTVLPAAITLGRSDMQTHQSVTNIGS